MSIYSKLTDEQLIISGESFDDIATELILRYAKTVSIKAAHFTSKQNEFDDLFQEGMLGLLSAVGKYKRDGNASFKTFAEVCIENRLKNAVKKASARPENADNVDVEILTENSGSTQSPEDIIVSRENLEHMVKKIHQNLSPLEYEVLEMTVGGYTYEQIAKRKSISLKAVDNALQRARRKLKSIFKQVFAALPLI